MKTKLPKLEIGHEYILPNEQEIMDEFVREMKAQVDRVYADKSMKRQVHTKMHGCVKAKFIVEENLDDRLRRGVFSEPKTFDAWVRFSNASSKPKPDKKKDIRGCAIKLMEVSGKKILPGYENELTQDFLLMSSETFFSRNIVEFRKILKAVVAKSKLPILLYFLNPMHWKLAGRFFKSNIAVENPLSIPYWSTQPYRFGNENQAVKYFLKPVTKIGNNQVSEDPGFLRKNLASELIEKEVAFDFYIQFQEDAETMPIEDPTVPWKSKFHKVAMLKVEKQECDSEERRSFGENLSFNPWHSLPEHQPLGNFNRARKVAYIEMSKYRHKWNKTEMKEPTL